MLSHGLLLQLHGLSLPDFSVYGILQARILEWVAISFSRGDLPDPGIEPGSPGSPDLSEPIKNLKLRISE